MQTEYAGSREPRPLRRRNSVSSPRIPSSPFTPSLTFRSPFIERRPDSPAHHADTPVVPNPESRPYTPPSPRPRPRQASRTKYRTPTPFLSADYLTNRKVFGLVFFGLWLVVWCFLDTYYGNLGHSHRHSEPRYPSNFTAGGYFRHHPVPPHEIPISKTSHRNSKFLPSKPDRIFHPDDLVEGISSASTISVVMPCPPSNLTTSLPRVVYALSTRYSSIGRIQTILLVCSKSQSRDALRIIESFTYDNVYVRTSHLDYDPSKGDLFSRRTSDLGLIHVAAQASTEWVVILDNEGVNYLPLSTITLLYHPPRAVKIPFGPKGVSVSENVASCLSNPAFSTSPSFTSFLVPPFSIRSSLLREAEAVLDMRQGLGVWAALGLRIALLTDSFGSESSGSGGLVVGMDLPQGSEQWCPYALSQLHLGTYGRLGLPQSTLEPTASSHLTKYFHSSVAESQNYLAHAGVFVVLVPGMTELLAIERMLCRSSRMGHILRILLYDVRTIFGYHDFDGCHLHYDSLSLTSNKYETIDDWLEDYAYDADLTIAVAEDPVWKSIVEWAILEINAARGPPLVDNILVWLPAEGLDFVEWCGTLSLEEWRHWNTPKIDLVVITNDRPASLERLLRSIKSAAYFGDQVTLHINVEQTADTSTEAQVHALEWLHGPIIVRHRVLLGGLLPAIVESWYPSSNDSYGVLLEDDVEVSPMFYAWVKMNILRYRYGPEHKKTQNLFGISLYQQKSIELRPSGREPFSAFSLFSSYGLPHPRTPYLSQIPCSWGAVYFPEHWRSFHAYLVDRLAERTHAIGTPIIAPSNRIRSNRWTRSWKKFFNEFVFLHGYVMLYPNYPNWTALSTNHLEVGVHVRGGEPHFERKRQQFDLPLMEHPPRGAALLKAHRFQNMDSVPRPTSILDIPLGKLPSWDALPVLDLWGYMSTHEELLERGLERYKELMADCELFQDRSPGPKCRDTHNSSQVHDEEMKEGEGLTVE